MSYLARRLEERLQPARLLPDLKSMIVLGHPYDSGLSNTHHPTEGHISRYAWGQDYHDVIREKLEAFKAWLIEREAQAHCYFSVDAGPVLEKGWAQKAGVGWLGKHTNILDAERGSYFFLSVLFTNLPFEKEDPVSDRCGSCEACLHACPTQAIVAPYVLDARLCISYLTIELKGPIPRHLRPLIGNRIFGCDDCQEVCPWNRFSRPTKEGRFFPREGVRNRPLAEFLSLDESAFRIKFAGSAVLRAKRRGFLRNVLVAIGNSGNPAWADQVREKLEDPEPLVRGHAVWAYGRLMGAGAKPVLIELKAREEDPFVLEEIQAEL